MVYRLSIKDHGTGIPDKDMPFIYEKFYRGETPVMNLERALDYLLSIISWTEWAEMWNL